jgi:DNA polymerase III delta prime subunit
LHTIEFTGNLSHAYILASPSEKIRQTEADRMTAAILCTGQGERPCGTCRNCRKVFEHIHPDVIVLERETAEKGKLKREIYVDQIRELMMSLRILPNEAERKVYVIQDAGAMNASAQNALLKGLEEPPEFAAFLLCVDNAGALLDTVRSRCVEINIQAEPEQSELTTEQITQAREYIERAASGDIKQLLSFCGENENMDNTAALDFTVAVRKELIGFLCGQTDYANLSKKTAIALIRLMERAETYLRANVGVKHVFGLLAVQTK